MSDAYLVLSSLRNDRGQGHITEVMRTRYSELIE